VAINEKTKTEKANEDDPKPCSPFSIARQLIALLVLMVLSGCAVGPDYQRPEATTIPAAYTGFR